MADRDFDLVCPNCRNYHEGYENCADCGTPCIVYTVNGAQYKKCPKGHFNIKLTKKCERCGKNLSYRKLLGNLNNGCSWIVLTVLGGFLAFIGLIIWLIL